MKRAVLFPVFFVVLGAAAGSLYFAQRRQKASPVSANALVELAADAQRDVTRIPLRYTRLSDEEEIAIGKDLTAQYGSIKQPMDAEQRALQEYVSRVGAKLAVHAHRPLPYQFQLIPDQNVINAFSLPGGTVYIGEGLTDLLMTEDELAAILAHEVEHVDHYHCVERIQIEAQLWHLNLGAVGALVQLPLSLWEAGYHKDEELEADREGMFLLVQSGYSPYGAVRLFELLGKLQREYVIHAETPEEELSDLAVQGLGGYFRTHPETTERLEQARRIIAAQNWQQRTGQQPFRIAYEIDEGAANARQ